MGILIHILVSTIAVLVASYILPGIHVKDFQTAVVVAVVLGIVNAVIKPILIILTLPVTLITLGLFLLVINALMVLLVANFVPGFTVDGFVWAVLFSIVVSIVGSFLKKV